MNQKFVHKVSPELTDDAQYKAISDIPASSLKQGSTILVYPGTYAPLAISTVFDNIAIVGMGDAAEVVFDVGSLIGNTSANTVSFENLTLKGDNSAADADNACIEAMETDTAVLLKFKEVIFSNAEHAVRYHGILGEAVQLDYCDATAVDQTIMSNANCTVNYSALNIAANAYFTSGGIDDPIVTVRASTAGAANTGATVETVLALLS